MSQTNPIVNPLSGEQIVILRTAAQTDGEVLDWELLLAPGGKVPSSHAHPEQEETFTVLEGRMRFRVGWRRLIADARRAPPGAAGNGASFRECRADRRTGRGRVPASARHGGTAGDGGRDGAGPACRWPGAPAAA